ncbi:MAG TPA: GAF domain-containing protein, partial [Byssovorax sp.]
MIVDDGLAVVRANEAFARLLGESVASVLGQPLFDLAPLSARARPMIEAVAAGGDAVLGFPLSIEWGDTLVDALPLTVGDRRHVLIEIRQVDAELMAAPGALGPTRSMFAEISRTLAWVSGPDVAPAVEHALRLVCDAYSLDRAYVRLLADDEQRYVLTHEAFRVPLAPLRDHAVGAAGLTWASPNFASGDAVVLADIAEIPASGESLRSALVDIGVHAAVGVPLMHGARVLGYVIFAQRTPRRWASTVVNRLQLAGEMIASALARAAAEEDLRDRLAFEESLTRVAARFVDLEPEQVDVEITRALGTFGEDRGLDRAIILTIDAGGRVLTLTHEWCAQGVSSMRPRFPYRPVDELS